MDTQNFDEIVRGLNTAGTRRNALMALAAGGLGWGFLRAEDEEAEEQALSPVGQHLQPGWQAALLQRFVLRSSRQQHPGRLMP